MPTHEPALVITDGGLGGLIACWAEGVCTPGLSDEHAPATIGWFPDPLPGGPSRRADAARRQLELCHLSDIVAWNAEDEPPEPAGRPARVSPIGIRHTRMLLAAGIHAVRAGIHRVIWPVHLGTPGRGEPGEEPLDVDLGPIADACDRALLVAQLIELDLGGGGAGRTLRIETPYADFSDRQMAEIALDLDAPLSAAWWCERAGPAACNACAECRRWAAAFESARRGDRAERVGDPLVTMPPRAEQPRAGRGS